MEITLSEAACENLSLPYNKGVRTVTFISFRRLVDEHLQQETDFKIVGINILPNGLELELE